MRICRKGDGAEDEHDEDGDMVGPPAEMGGGDNEDDDGDGDGDGERGGKDARD